MKIQVRDTEGVVVEAEQALGPTLVNVLGVGTQCADETNWIIYKDGNIIGVIADDVFNASFTTL